MKYNKDWKNKSGIYSIQNKINKKRYIGKSVNLYIRLKSHTTGLNNNSLNENPYLLHSWKKYGEDNFIFSVIEYCDKELLSSKELYYINFYNTLNKEFGYNLRLDSSSGMIPSPETRIKQSLSQIKRQLNMSEEERNNTKLRTSNMWKKWTKDEINIMMNKVSLSRTIYKWYQYTKDNELVRTWNSIREILKSNPSYKRHNIYAVASGEKPSIYGYIWKKELK